MKSYNTKSSHIQEYLVLYVIIIIWHGMEFSWIARYAMLYDSSVKAPPHARYGLCWVSPGAGYPFLWGVMSVRWPCHGQPTPWASGKYQMEIFKNQSMEHKSKFWLQTKTQDNHQSSCSHDLDDILVKQGSIGAILRWSDLSCPSHSLECASRHR